MSTPISDLTGSRDDHPSPPSPPLAPLARPLPTLRPRSPAYCMNHAPTYRALCAPFHEESHGDDKYIHRGAARSRAPFSSRIPLEPARAEK